jgi:phosphoribosylformylglycinamidine synthase subunit PurQ / glutaminase
MPQPIKAIVITGNGTNCETEMAHACRLAGFDTVEIVHISELLCGTKRLDDYQFLNLPGGFLDGDDLGSAKAGANRILHASVAGTGEMLFAQFIRFIAAGKLILGVCNGFQLLVKLGMLPGFDGLSDRQTATLTFNDSGRFEDRWVHLRPDAASPCVFTKGLKGLTLPVRHGEGSSCPWTRRSSAGSTGSASSVCSTATRTPNGRRSTTRRTPTARWTRSPGSATKRGGSSA